MGEGAQGGGWGVRVWRVCGLEIGGFGFRGGFWGFGVF